MLDLDFSPEQELLRATARDLLSRYCPRSVVRQMEDDPTGYPAELWQKMGELDLIGLLLPEEYGGSRMSLVEGVALYEELGRSLAPVPHFVSAVLAGGLLARRGTGEQKDAWLPAIASGESVWSVAWLEPGGGYAPEGVRATAVPCRPDGTALDTPAPTADATDPPAHYRLDGTKRHVAFAASSTRLLTLARDHRGQIALFAVDPQAPGVTLSQQHTLASDTQYQARFDGVVVRAEDRIGADPAGREQVQGATWDDFSRVLSDGCVLLAAQAVGGARYALDITVQYAKDRQQFDKPLGAFQAIAHYLADAVTRVDGAEQLVHEAAWAAAAGKPTDRLAPMAKLFACQTFRDVTAMAQQVFGGIGFTLEFDIQLYFRRAKQLQLSWADSRTLEERVAESVLA